MDGVQIARPSVAVRPWELAFGRSVNLLLSCLTNRTFAVVDSHMDFCNWTSSPICNWTASVPNEITEAIKTYFVPEKKRPPDVNGLVKQIKGISVGRGPCTFLKELKCMHDLNGDVSKKRIVVVVSMVWFANFLLTNVFYTQRLERAFGRVLASGRHVTDFYGPLARWAFAPRAEIETELEAQIPKRRIDSESLPLSVCVQARWGLETEMIKIDKCITDLEQQSWWPGNNVFF